MMKDQFANYVVQKVLETCDDQQLELILNRIKDHLNALKKYTYGKHIVARVEKLVAAGGILSPPLEIIYNNPHGLLFFHRYICFRIVTLNLYVFTHSRVQSIAERRIGILSSYSA